MRIDVLFSLAILLVATTAMLADLAPPSGYRRIAVRILIEPAEDLPDYRFFIKSGADVEELKLTKGLQTSVGPLGGGALYSRGTLIAVPIASLTGLSDAPNAGRLSDLKQAVYDGKAAGAIELVAHDFFKEVRDEDAGAWKDPVYRIERDAAKGLKAVRISAATANGSAGATYYSNDPKSGIFWSSVAGASLLTLAAIFFGGWMVRRRTAKSRSI